MKRSFWPIFCTTLALFAGSSWAGPAKEQPVPDVLESIDIGRKDIGLRADATPPPYVMPVVEAFLRDPVTNFPRAQEWGEWVLLSQNDPELMLSSIGKFASQSFSEVDRSTEISGTFSIGKGAAEPWLKEALGRFGQEVSRIRQEIKKRTDRLPKKERQALDEVIASAYRDVESGNASFPVLQREVVRKEEVLSTLGDLPTNFWWLSAYDLTAAVQRLKFAVMLHKDAFDSMTTRRLETSEGQIILGGIGSDSYELGPDDWFVLELGGDDSYRGAPASGQNGRVSVVLDLGGNDSYVSTQSFTLGAGHWGVGLLQDEQGDDVYRAGDQSIGAGICGAGILIDRDGDDIYAARDVAQGAGIWGVGLLSDMKGDDAFRVGRMGQGFAGVGGVGVLAEAGGNDEYFSGALWADPREQNVFHSMAQGFSMGIRDYTAGGIGALLDGGGHDSYRSDYFGQGASYWYSMGLLYDREGRDTYSGRRYSQGAGVHTSVGLLLDVLGGDSYTAWGGSQGMGWDQGIGVLVDQLGDDTYSADWGSQGMGGGGYGFMSDNGGSDLYYAKSDHGEGYGLWEDSRHSAGVGFFLDGGGTDRYPRDGREGGVWNLERWGLGVDASSSSAALFNLRTNVPVPVSNKFQEQLAQERAKLEQRLSTAETLTDPVLRVSEILAVAGHWGLDEETPRKARQRLLGMSAFELFPALTQSMDCRQTMGYILQEEFYLRQGPSAVFSLRDRLHEIEISTIPSVPGKLASSERLRVLALFYLGQTGSVEAVPVALPRLSDSSSKVRAAAARALGEIYDSRHRMNANRLRTLLEGKFSPELGKTLSAIPYGDRLRLLFDVEPLTKPIFDKLMEPSIMATRPEVAEEWAKFLWDGKKTLVPLLKKREERPIDSAVVPALKKLLTDPEASVRHAAAVSLGQTGDPNAISALWPLLSDSETLVRNAASWSLGRKPDTTLLGSIVKSSSALEKKGALEGLSNAASPDVRSLFEEALKDADWSVRFRALDLLWRKRDQFYLGLDPAEVSKQLKSLLEPLSADDDNPWVRAKAKTCLAELGRS